MGEPGTGVLEVQKVAIESIWEFSEMSIYDAMQFGFSQNREFTTDDILGAIADCIPLAKIASHQIEALKDWASRSGAKSASLVDSANNNLLPLLEVDYQDELTNN